MEPEDWKEKIEEHCFGRRINRKRYNEEKSKEEEYRKKTERSR